MSNLNINYNILFSIIFSSLITLSFCYGSEDDIWTRLLHVEEKKLTGGELFYIHENNSAEKEMEQSISELKSNHGQEFACAFPARYLYLKARNENLDFNLSNCKNLTEFKKEFNKKKLSIAFASEYANSPESAFGHIFLIFHNEDQPELNSITIQFAADTDTKYNNFLDYTYKGIAGGFYGYYYRDFYFNKIYENTILQTRFIYSHQLNITDQQKEFLVYHLFELQKAKFQYKFISQNCSTKIQDLLDIVLTKQATSKYYTPIYAYKKYNNMFVKSAVEAPLYVKLKSLIRQTDIRQQTNIYSIIHSSKPDTLTLSDTEGQIISSTTKYLFKSENFKVDNYAYLKEISPKQIVTTNFNTDFPEFRTGFTQLSLVNFFSKNYDTYQTIKFSPFISSRQQFNRILEIEAEIEIASVAINNKINSSNIDSLKILKLSSFKNYDFVLNQLSWSLELGQNRSNLDSQYNEYLEINWGVTHSNENIYRLGVLTGPQINLRAPKPFLLNISIFFEAQLNQFQKVIMQANKSLINDYVYDESQIEILNKIYDIHIPIGLIQSKNNPSYYTIGMTYQF